jgi:hypothetical protein
MLQQLALFFNLIFGSSDEVPSEISDIPNIAKFKTRPFIVILALTISSFWLPPHYLPF